MMKVKIICKTCGIIFDVRSSRARTAKYCSMICRSNNKNLVDIKCKVCDKIFNIHPSKINRKYCSVNCYNKRELTKVNITCEICCKFFMRSPSYAKIAKYCSKECQTKSYTNVTGSRHKTSTGYIKIKTNDGWMFEHKKFEKYKCAIKNYLTSYCSKKCSYIAMLL